MASVLAIDPGDEHCGMALFDNTTGEWEPRSLWEDTPPACIASAREWLEGGVSTIVIEEFRLYPWKSNKQAWSDLKTSQLIGALKLAWWLGRKTDDQTLVMQPASIKKPTKAQTQARGVTLASQTSRLSIHVQDAELHGWYWILSGQKPGHTTLEGAWYDDQGRSA